MIKKIKVTQDQEDHFTIDPTHSMKPVENRRINTKTTRLDLINKPLTKTTKTNMTQTNYKRTFRVKSKQIKPLFKLSPKRLKYITLTTSKPSTLEQFKKDVKKFIKKFICVFNPLGQVERIECNEQDDQYHSHLLFVFLDRSPLISFDWLKKYWTLGIVNIQTPCGDNINNLINYFIKAKDNDYIIGTPYTKFPARTRIEYISPFLRSKVLNEFIIDKASLNNIKTKALQLNVIIEYEGHYWNNKWIMDKIHFVGSKENIKLLLEFIESIEIKC